MHSSVLLLFVYYYLCIYGQRKDVITAVTLEGFFLMVANDNVGERKH